MPRRCQSVPDDAISKSAAKLRLLKRLRCTLNYEKQAWAAGARVVAGVDEVGRGSLFGPVVAAAVVLDPARRIRGLRDSKLLPSERREELAARIREHALGFAIASVDHLRIDEINIYQASRQAMAEAVAQLLPAADHLLIDAMTIDWDVAQTPIIHGDALSASIAAASIIAKVARDQMMRELDAEYPLYGLAANKGYATPKHMAALREHGPSLLHRRTFLRWLEGSPQQALAFMEEAALVVE